MSKLFFPRWPNCKIDRSVPLDNGKVHHARTQYWLRCHLTTLQNHEFRRGCSCWIRRCVLLLSDKFQNRSPFLFALVTMSSSTIFHHHFPFRNQFDGAVFRRIKMVNRVWNGVSCIWLTSFHCRPTPHLLTVVLTLHHSTVKCDIIRLQTSGTHPSNNFLDVTSVGS
jgi:hypothetical protein